MTPLRLAVRDWPGDPGRFLLLHGLSSNAAGWWRLAPDIAALGFAVSAPDLRGHGASPHASDYSLEGYAADVLAGGGSWDCVLGHSLGGAVALTALAADPAFTARLILFEPALVIHDPEAAKFWLLAPWQTEISATAVAKANPKWNATDVAHKAEALFQSGSAVVEGTFDDNPRWDLRAQVANIAVPTLVVAADPAHGSVVAPATMREISANPLVETMTLNGGGHSLHREDAYYAELVAAIQKFLA